MLNERCIGLQDEACVPREDSLQEIVAETIDMARNCRGISYSIESGLFGPRVQNEKGKESNINCLADALKEVRYVLGETINTLEAVSRKL